jgi:hypothetical protein
MNRSTEIVFHHNQGPPKKRQELSQIYFEVTIQHYLDNRIVNNSQHSVINYIHNPPIFLYEIPNIDEDIDDDDIDDEDSDDDI